MSSESGQRLTRRRMLRRSVGFGTAAWLAGGVSGSAQDAPTRPGPRGRVRARIAEKVRATPLIDTHEHLIEEAERLQGTAHPRVQCDDWAYLLSHYLNSDLLTAGMPREAWNALFAPGADPVGKWRHLEPWWPAVKNTGYGQAVRIACRELYGVEDLSTSTIRRVQDGYDSVRRPGFYREVLQKRAGIESCQVNCLTGEPFKESAMPELLMQDISIVGMFSGPDLRTFAEPTGIAVRSLSDWHRVIEWWFDRYGEFAVAVKSQNAYSRDIDYRPVEAGAVEGIFTALLNDGDVSREERRALEDHLFWKAVKAATARQLPIKLHTGYYAGQDGMPLGRVAQNPASACDLCRAAPESAFVFMHIGYPYESEMIALAKHYTNAHIDMCWAWIIDPLAAKTFLKRYLVTAPANKLLCFGGDYIPVEPVLGHAMIARQGITQALTELVQEDWMGVEDALEVADLIMHGNARRIFRLEQRLRALRNAPWRRTDE